MSTTIHTDFPGGCLGAVESAAPGALTVRLYREHAADGVHTQATWFYARLSGLEGQPLALTLSGLGDVWNGRPSFSINERDLPVVSDDGRAWRRLAESRFDRAAGTVTFDLEPAGDVLWLAMLEPYGPAELAVLSRAVLAHPEGRGEVAGLTVGGRPLALWSIGDEAAPHCVWVLARQHAWEAHTSWCAEGLVRWLLSDQAAEFRRRCVVKILPLMDPDGVVRGGTRYNAHGYDVNRHWDATDPADPEHRRLRPEICAALAATDAWCAAGRPIDLHLNLHDTQTDVMILAAGMAAAGPVVGLHARLVAAGFTGPLQADGLAAGAAEDGVRRRYRVSAALIELGTAQQPGCDHPPTAAERVAFGADLGRGLAAVI
jgi:hypothetical protein